MNQLRLLLTAILLGGLSMTAFAQKDGNEKVYAMEGEGGSYHLYKGCKVLKARADKSVKMKADDALSKGKSLCDVCQKKWQKEQDKEVKKEQKKADKEKKEAQKKQKEAKKKQKKAEKEAKKAAKQKKLQEKAIKEQEKAKKAAEKAKKAMEKAGM